MSNALDPGPARRERRMRQPVSGPVWAAVAAIATVAMVAFVVVHNGSSLGQAAAIDPSAVAAASASATAAPRGAVPASAPRSSLREDAAAVDAAQPPGATADAPGG